MNKQYTDAGVTRSRKITKPITGTVSVAVDGSTVTTGFTINYSTGIITFDSAVDVDNAVTWGGQFHVPVRFGKEIDGAIVLTQDDFGVRSAQDIPLIELTDPGASTDEFFYGGAVELCLTANYTASVAQARLYILAPQVGGLSFFLPDTAEVPFGGPIFFIMNQGPNSILIKTDGGSTLLTLASGKGCEILLSVDSDTNPIWYAR